MSEARTGTSRQSVIKMAIWVGEEDVFLDGVSLSGGVSLKVSSPLPSGSEVKLRGR